MDTAQERAAVLLAERNAALDDLLSRWHHWQLGARVGRGHSDRSLVTGDYRTSRQYDDQNGALYDDEEVQTMRAVQACVDNLIDPYRTVVYVLARALYLGTSAFVSPRLPADRAMRAELEAEARRRLIARLVDAGVILDE